MRKSCATCGRTYPAGGRCPVHGRPADAPWSPNRDGAAHKRLARAVRRRASRCEGCGAAAGQVLASGERARLQVHHVDGDVRNNRPDNGILLCQVCHRAVDFHAR